MRQRALGAFGVAVFACGCLVLVWTTVMAFCRGEWWRPTESPPVDTYDLIMDVSAFPDGWEVWHGPAPIPERERGERESLYVAFHYKGLDPTMVGAHHKVYRYRDEGKAAWMYSAFSEEEFLPWHTTTPWAIPDGWSYESRVADYFKFACVEEVFVTPYWTCTALSQYGQYISVFATDLSPEYMTLEDIERILLALDERMAFYLKIDTE